MASRTVSLTNQLHQETLSHSQTHQESPRHPVLLAPVSPTWSPSVPSLECASTTRCVPVGWKYSSTVLQGSGLTPASTTVTSFNSLTVYLMRSAMSTISSRSFTSGTNLRNCTYPGYSITFLKLCRIYLVWNKIIPSIKQKQNPTSLETRLCFKHLFWDRNWLPKIIEGSEKYGFHRSQDKPHNQISCSAIHISV